MLYANCILVKGFNRTALYDLHNGSIQILPNEIYDIFKTNNIINIHKTLGTKSPSDKKIIQEYFDFLIDEEYGEYVDEKAFEYFKPLPKQYYYPSNVSNIIIDINDFNIKKFNKIIDQVVENNIANVEIRIFDNKFSLNHLNEINAKLYNTIIKHVSLVLPYDNFAKVEIDKICLFRFTQIIFYNTTEDRFIEHNGVNVTYSVKKNINHKSCGIVDISYFSVNIPSFSESLNHNSCLNGKISIDIDGNIKNCPAMNKTFGNIDNTTLYNALAQVDFKDYWDITKDQIEICKDCEFRHACTDCRAFIENPKDILSKPLKCGYNPYTNIWEEWSTNPLKEKSIKFYELDINSDINV